MKKDLWEPKRRIERDYARTLENITKQINQAIAGTDDPAIILHRLRAIGAMPEFKRYAEATAMKMSTQLYTDNGRTWRQAARESSKGRAVYSAIMSELKNPQIGGVVSQKIAENANLISSLPSDMAREATEYIQKRTMEGSRSKDIAKELKERFPKLSDSRAKLIARTEVSKANTAFTQARAQALGLNWYIWRTSQDAKVRSPHAHMEGVLVSWSDPPDPESLFGGKSYGSYHAGNIFNCRCYPEPVVNIDRVSWPTKVHIAGHIEMMTKVAFLKRFGVGEEEPEPGLMGTEENTLLGGGSATVNESEQVKQMLRSLPEPKANDAASRKAFAEKLMDNLGIDRTGIQVTVEKTAERGFCGMDIFRSSDAQMLFNRYSLQLDDNRMIGYQTKTAFHELFHLMGGGKKTDYYSLVSAKKKDRWQAIEETFAEASAQYAAKVYGIKETLHPAYPKYLVRVLPRLKQTAEFSSCNSIADFGKIALEKRLAGGDSEWGELYRTLFIKKGLKSFDDDAYFSKYLPHIEQNRDRLMARFFENDPSLKIHQKQMVKEIDRALEEIKNGGKFTSLVGNEKMLLENLLLAAMNEKGVL